MAWSFHGRAIKTLAIISMSVKKLTISIIVKGSLPFGISIILTSRVIDALA